MSIEKGRAYFRALGLEDRVQEFTVSSATVELAAQALGVEGARIAKTLSFKTEDGCMLILAAGDARIDNKKFKAKFHMKAKMLSADEVLEFLGLQHVRNELAKNLPHGYQKILGVARALATKPKLLLLDEPLGGMNPEEIAFSIDAISKMRDKGISILVVEHNMQILDILDSVTVISFGQKIFEGTPEGMRQDQTVIDTYFGGAV